MSLIIGMRDKKEEEEEKEKENHFLTKFLIPFGAVLIAAIAFLTANYQLPTWAVIAVIAYLVVIMLVTLWKPSTRLFSLLREKWLRRRLSKTFYPYLQNSGVEFGRLVEDQKTNTIIYLLQDISRWPEIYNNPIPFDREYIRTIREWLVSVQDYLNSHRLRDFKRIAHDFSVLVSQYNISCVRIQERLEQLITQSKITDDQNHLRQLKREWNLHREGHIHFIRDWEILTKNINDSFGRCCVDYYEPLKTLE